MERVSGREKERKKEREEGKRRKNTSHRCSEPDNLYQSTLSNRR